MYISGYSIISIIRELKQRGIKSPTGKETWCKRLIETILDNEKYSGDVAVFKTCNTVSQMLNVKKTTGINLNISLLISIRRLYQKNYSEKYARKEHAEVMLPAETVGLYENQHDTVRSETKINRGKCDLGC